MYITDDNVPPLQWPLGGVKQFYVERSSFAIVRVMILTRIFFSQCCWNFQEVKLMIQI